MQLQELVDSFSLQICNDPHRLEFDDAWTYQHTLHGRHHIDFILASRHFQIEDGKAVSELDLGSDHRAVRATLKMQTRIQRRRQRTRPSARTRRLPHRRLDPHPKVFHEYRCSTSGGR